MTAAVNKRSKPRRDILFPVINACILCVLMFITLYPVINTVAISFNDGTDALRGGIGLWPRQFSLKAYETLLTDEQIYTAFGISVSRTIITTILNVILTSMLAFALSRREYVLRGFITIVMVMTMYVNAGLIPNYLLISNTLKLRGTYWVYIIPTMFSCFNMIVIRTYIAGLPEALAESARIDGANDLRIFWQIVMPNVKPAWLTMIIFSVQGLWNAKASTVIYSEAKKTLVYALQQIQAGGIARTGQAAAVTVVVMIVPIITFVLSQSQILETMATSGLKD